MIEKIENKSYTCVGYSTLFLIGNQWREETLVVLFFPCENIVHHFPDESRNLFFDLYTKLKLYPSYLTGYQLFFDRKKKKKVMNESNSAIFQTFQLCPDTFGHNFFFGFVDQKTIGNPSSRKDRAFI